MNRTLLSISFIVMLSLASAAHASPLPVRALFGITPAQTSCEDGMKRIDVKRLDANGMAVSKNVAHLYPGAKVVYVVCHQAKVVFIGFEADKGGMGSPAPREAYATLAGKYKRIAGGPIPELGNGYAVFESSGVVVEIESQHLSFTFTVTFQPRDVFDARMKQEAQDARDLSAKKASAL